MLKFFKTEAASGVLLLIVTIVTLVLVNSPLAYWHSALLQYPLFDKDLTHWVNDGLMVLFFYVVGLEIKKELLFGALSKPKDAALPVFAALGGMIFPALIYLAFNSKGDTQHGWGIPMATDIAFAVGVITLFGKRIPASLKAFLLAFAIIDDLGAILVIALFYSKDLAVQYLGYASAILFVLYFLSKTKFRSFVFGVLCGVAVWFCFLESGVHATIAGVILALLTPADKKVDKQGEGENRLDHWLAHLHPWVAFGIMPIFAFFNAGVNIGQLDFTSFTRSSVTLGVFLGLVIGKPVGIILFCGLARMLSLARIPRGVTWWHLLATGCLGGIGFTMSLFIGSLAFENPAYEMLSKGAILAASVVSGVLGYILLGLILRLKPKS